jgi:hypothetical protein
MLRHSLSNRSLKINRLFELCPPLRCTVSCSALPGFTSIALLPSVRYAVIHCHLMTREEQLTMNDAEGN